MKGLALLLAGLAALLPAACGQPQPRDARPPLWRAGDGDTTIWLLGTIHLLPANVRWQTGRVADAIAQADTLVTEIPDGDPQAQAAAFLKLARADNLPPLAERVAGAPARFDRLKTWGAALAIGSEAARSAGATRENGVEATLSAAFAGRRHEALESFAGQLALFDTLPEAAQRHLLATTLREAADPAASYARTYDAWAGGDDAAILRDFTASFADAPVLREVLVTKRNSDWATRLAARMKRPGRLLVAVGAGHLVGPNGVPALLAGRGFRVSRLQ